MFAFQKFLERNGRDLENKKQLIMLRKRIAELEQENNELKERLYAQQNQKVLCSVFSITFHSIFILEELYQTEL